MRRRLAYSRDTLQTALLPATEYMELNYRPALPPAAPLVLSVVGFFGTLVAVVTALFWALEILGPFVGYLLNGTALLCVLFIVLAYLNSQQFHSYLSWQSLWRYATLFAAILGLVVIAVLNAARGAHSWVFVPAVAVTVLFSYCCAKQFAYWAAVNPAVDWREMRFWQALWPKLLSTSLPPECPELLTTRAAFLVLVVQGWLGYETFAWLLRLDAGAPLRQLAGPLALAAMVAPLPIYWLVWHAIGIVPRMSWSATWQATARSLQVWLAYDPSPAPGIFVFPDRWLRSAWMRRFILIVALVSITTSILMFNPDPTSTAPVVLVDALAKLLFGLPPSDGWTVWQLMATVVAAACLPIVLLLTAYWFLFGSLLARYWLALETPGGYAQSRTKSPWAISINRMLNSRDHKEREHVLLGRSLFGDNPVLLHKPLLYQHAHLVGDSGSRKTSLGIAPLIAQLVAARDCSVVVLDLKGDRALFETARLEAAAAGADFRWFALQSGLSSHVFNPLEQSYFARLSPHQRTQINLEGLSLNYGDAYGRGFFSAMNEVVLLNFMRHYRIPTFRRLHTLLSDRAAFLAIGGNPDDWKKAQHLTALVDRLASIFPLNVLLGELDLRSPVRTAAIDMGDLLTRPQVAYFYLQSPIEPIGAPAVAKLVLHSLFSAAAQRLRNQKQRVYVVIDEFQQVVSESVRLVFEQARSSNVHFIVAHQNVEQLDRKGVDVRDTVSSCTAFKQFFRASDPKTIKLLEEMSGQGMFETLSWQQRVDAWQNTDADSTFTPYAAEKQLVAVSETTGYRLERNLIMDISAAPNTSFVSFTEGSHFTQFSSYVTPIISDYHIDIHEYGRRSRAAWPAATDETVVVPAPSEPAALPSQPQSPAGDWDERIRQLG